jgi:large subunit ribosomal protein L10
MDRAQKKQAVADVNSTLSEMETVIVTHNKGLTVAQITELRRRIRKSGASMKVVKNRLVKIGLKGTKFEPLSDLFKGPTSVTYSKDPVAAAKAIVEFAKTNEKLVVLGGAMGNTVLDTNGVKNLASMPSLDELRAKLVGLVNAPATKLVQVIQAPPGQLARIFGAKAAKGD